MRVALLAAAVAAFAAGCDESPKDFRARTARAVAQNREVEREFNGRYEREIREHRDDSPLKVGETVRIINSGNNHQSDRDVEVTVTALSADGKSATVLAVQAESYYEHRARILSTATVPVGLLYRKTWHTTHYWDKSKTPRVEISAEQYRAAEEEAAKKKW